MNTDLSITQLQRACQLFEAEHTINGRLEVLRNKRIKAEVRDSLSFSTRLNEWIIEWFVQHPHIFTFVDEDDFNPDDIQDTLNKHREHFLRTGRINIWTGASKNTIFADAGVNCYFRAWHDYIHITENLPYDFAGETAVAKIQQSQLPMDWGYERALIDAEVVGQALHHMKYGEFVVDQRAFALEFLECGKVTNKF